MRKLRYVVAAALFVSGCAYQWDTRYDYSGLTGGLVNYDPSILDWNFPTSHNQPPLLPPERLRPWQPAVGVPWATSDWMPWQQGTPPPAQKPNPFFAPLDETLRCANDCAASAEPADDPAPAADADAGERRDVSMRR